MEIVKRLITQDSSEVNAVLLRDEGEEYPVFLDSLHNTIIFPTLLESGYQLTKLPYGFVKNGIPFDSLPVENITVTDIQQEMMFNSIGVRLPLDEIKSKLTVTASTGIVMPDTNYTIFTREELIRYLEASAIATDEDDFLPLNYFVAPEARFTFEEYFDIENHRYVELITNRRRMSLRKFQKLCNWLKSYGISEGSSVMDILDTYFAWGFDGITTTILSKRRETRPFKLDVNPTKQIPAKRFTVGFADGAGNQLTPKNERGVAWHLIMKDMEFNEHISGLKYNDTKVTRYMSSYRQDITVLECTSNINITYSEDIAVIDKMAYQTLYVESPVDKSINIDLSMAIPSGTQRLIDHCLLESMAQLLYDMRKPRVRVSSYDVLTACGCTPSKALDYVAVDLRLDKDPMMRKTAEEQDLPYIDNRVIDNYLSGKYVSDDAIECIEAIMDGTLCIDRIGMGKDADSMFNTETYYNALYAVHNVFEISLEDIYAKIKSITPDTKYLVFEGPNGIMHTIDVTPLRGATMGYLTDFKDYNLRKGKDSSYFTYVTLIAREVGVETANRHVGIEFYVVNRTKPEVSEIIDKLTSMYEDKVSYTLSNAREQANMLRAASNWAYNAYFELVFNGTITYPTKLGGESITVDSSMKVTASKYLQRKIEMLTSYCDTLTITTDINSLSFNGFCVNAYITPTFVIPKKGRTIKEVPFYTAWCDWRNTNPDVFAQLVQMDILPADWSAWSLRYVNEQFYERTYAELGDNDTLLHYYDRAVQEVQDYPEDMDFVSVTHPIEYMYPGMYARDEDDDESFDKKQLAVPRNGAPVIRLGQVRTLDYESFEYKLFPTESNEEPDQYIKPFCAFTTEELFNIDNPFTKIPYGISVITVHAESKTLYLGDTGETMDFRRLIELDSNKYPIVHLYDRKYLLLAADGTIWEVRI